jgi:hypothetical protein
LIEYLKAVHANTGNIEAECFMSDCTDQYYVAWSSAFNTTTTCKLLCMWHADRAWRKALKEHISNM